MKGTPGPGGTSELHVQRAESTICREGAEQREKCVYQILLARCSSGQRLAQQELWQQQESRCEHCAWSCRSLGHLVVIRAKPHLCPHSHGLRVSAWGLPAVSWFLADQILLPTFTQGKKCLPFAECKGMC